MRQRGMEGGREKLTWEPRCAVEFAAGQSRVRCHQICQISILLCVCVLFDSQRTCPYRRFRRCTSWMESSISAFCVSTKASLKKLYFSEAGIFQFDAIFIFVLYLVLMGFRFIQRPNFEFHSVSVWQQSCVFPV